MSALKICPQCGTEYELDQRFCPKDGSTLRTQNTGGDLVGEIIADRYHVLKKLGEGGMGQVYLAEHVKMGRKSAVKVMNPGMTQDPDAISRFNREAANASRINHPNICAIYDFGETSDGLIYLAMEFIEGDSLTKVIERQGALPAARAADIAHQTADALGVAHEHGIVHRDLKPDNIMIAKGRDGRDLVKVVDFGIAKAGTSEAQKVTKTGLVVGTPEYMSPEQLAGDKLDGRSDLYSLGLVAFNMLTGKLPFPSETVQEAMIMRLTDRPRTLAEMKPDVEWPEELQAVMDKILARDVNERYAHAADFGRDFVSAVQGMPATVASGAGTQMMGAMPSTRVGATPAGATVKTTATPRGPGAPTTKVGAGGVPAGATRPAVAPTRPTPPPVKHSSKVPAVIGAAVLVAALAGGGWYVAIGRKAGSVTNGTAAVPSGSQTTQPAGSRGAQGPAIPAGNTGGPEVPPAGSSGTTRTGSTTRTGGNTGGSPSGPALSVPREFERIKLLIDFESPNATDAQNALGLIDNLMPRLNNRDDIVEAKYHRAEAYMILDSLPRACNILNGLKAGANGTRMAKSVESALAACQ